MIDANTVRSVIITAGPHTLQLTRLTLTDTEWLMTMDGQHLARRVDTAHVQAVITQNTLAGNCTIDTFAD